MRICFYFMLHYSSNVALYEYTKQFVQCRALQLNPSFKFVPSNILNKTFKINFFICINIRNIKNTVFFVAVPGWPAIGNSGKSGNYAEFLSSGKNRELYVNFGHVRGIL